MAMTEDRMHEGLSTYGRRWREQQPVPGTVPGGFGQRHRASPRRWVALAAAAAVAAIAGVTWGAHLSTDEPPATPGSSRPRPSRRPPRRPPRRPLPARPSRPHRRRRPPRPRAWSQLSASSPRWAARATRARPGRSRTDPSTCDPVTLTSLPRQPRWRVGPEHRWPGSPRLMRPWVPGSMAPSSRGHGRPGAEGGEGSAVGDLAVFGSVARGRARADSDLDMLSRRAGSTIENVTRLRRLFAAMERRTVTELLRLEEWLGRRDRRGRQGGG